MNWNWSHRTRLMIAGSIGVAMILFGISEGVFHYWVEPKAANEVCLFMMVAAVAVLFSGRGKGQQKDETDQTKQETPSEPKD